MKERFLLNVLCRCDQSRKRISIDNQSWAYRKFWVCNGRARQHCDSGATVRTNLWNPIRFSLNSIDSRALSEMPFPPVFSPYTPNRVRERGNIKFPRVAFAMTFFNSAWWGEGEEEENKKSYFKWDLWAVIKRYLLYIVELESFFYFQLQIWNSMRINFEWRKFNFRFFKTYCSLWMLLEEECTLDDQFNSKMLRFKVKNRETKILHISQGLDTSNLGH